MGYFALLQNFCRTLNIRSCGYRLERHDCYFGCPCDAIALLENDATEPAGKCGRLAQVSKSSVGFEKCLLRGILGEVEIAQSRIRVTDRHVLKPSDDPAVSFGVAVA